MIPWKLHVRGKLFHSGLAHKVINPFELAMEALKEIQMRFYRDFLPHSKEEVYGFTTPSTMKSTQWACSCRIATPIEKDVIVNHCSFETQEVESSNSVSLHNFRRCQVDPILQCARCN